MKTKNIKNDVRQFTNQKILGKKRELDYLECDKTTILTVWNFAETNKASFARVHNCL